MRIDAHKYNSVLKRAEIYEISVKLVTPIVMIVTPRWLRWSEADFSPGSCCLSEVS